MLLNAARQEKFRLDHHRWKARGKQRDIAACCGYAEDWPTLLPLRPAQGIEFVIAHDGKG
jgi:hypothetical protein